MLILEGGNMKTYEVDEEITKEKFTNIGCFEKS